MLAMRTVALAAGFSLAMVGLAGTAAADDHHHHNGHHHNGHHHHGDFNEGYGFAFDIPDVYVDLSNGNSDDAHVSWCYRHKPNYNEDYDMYFSHGNWKPCIAPFD